VSVADGATVGAAVVGATVGTAVVGATVGAAVVGATVGAAVVGATVGAAVVAASVVAAAVVGAAVVAASVTAATAGAAVVAGAVFVTVGFIVVDSGFGVIVGVGLPHALSKSASTPTAAKKIGLRVRTILPSSQVKKTSTKHNHNYTWLSGCQKELISVPKCT
jgi:hypothetical protein